MSKLKHPLEAGALSYLFSVLKLLPLDMASSVGSLLARALGPVLPIQAHRIANENLKMIYPDMTDKERRRILEAMWDNLGRTAAELPHLPGEKLHTRWTINGIENMPRPGTQVLFFSGHLGNWELLPPVSLSCGVPVTLVYRPANNPKTDAIMAKLRAPKSSGMVPKGPKGAIKLVRAIKDGNSLAMLVDQKMNDGIAVPFFGRDAMTAPALAQLALRYGLPIIPARVVRTGGCHFRVDIFPALKIESTGDGEKDALAIMTQINAILEKWIREYPEQWFWVHRRWPKG